MLPTHRKKFFKHKVLTVRTHHIRPVFELILAAPAAAANACQRWLAVEEAPVSKSIKRRNHVFKLYMLPQPSSVVLKVEQVDATCLQQWLGSLERCRVMSLWCPITWVACTRVLIHKQHTSVSILRILMVSRPSASANDATSIMIAASCPVPSCIQFYKLYGHKIPN